MNHAHPRVSALRENMEGRRVGLLVADSGAFIKQAPLEKWSNGEILPYDIQTREPTQTSLQYGKRL